MSELLRTLRFITGHPLNRHRKGRALLQFAAWQAWSRMVPGPHVCRWVSGTKLLVSRGETGLTGNLYAGLHDFEDMGFLLHFLRSGDLFVDVGANSGGYTVLAGAVSRARVCAFEPVPATLGRLEANVRLNGLEDRVRWVGKCVGAQPGVVEFSLERDTENHVLPGPRQPGRSVPVEVTTLDAELVREEPALIKLDVEGFETAVLDGAGETLKKESLLAIILEMNGGGRIYGFDESKIPVRLRESGFNMYTYAPLTRKLAPLAAKNPVGNTLFLRDVDTVAERLAKAPLVKILGTRF